MEAVLIRPDAYRVVEDGMMYGHIEIDANGKIRFYPTTTSRGLTLPELVEISRLVDRFPMPVPEG